MCMGIRVPENNGLCVNVKYILVYIVRVKVIIMLDNIVVAHHISSTIIYVSSAWYQEDIVTRLLSDPHWIISNLFYFRLNL